MPTKESLINETMKAFESAAHVDIDSVEPILEAVTGHTVVVWSNLGPAQLKEIRDRCLDVTKPR